MMLSLMTTMVVMKKYMRYVILSMFLLPFLSLYFCKVDVPYHLAKLQADIDEKKIRSLKPPHWKQKKSGNPNDSSTDSIVNKHKYHKSEKALGKMWDLMATKLSEVINEEATAPDQRILDFVTVCVEKDRTTKDKLGGIRRTMMNAIDEYEKVYKNRRNMSKDGTTNLNTNESWFDGLDEYYQDKRKTLIDNEKDLYTRQLHAAVLYEQGSKFKTNQKLGLRFAWLVGLDVLCKITSDASTKVGEPLPLQVHTDDRQNLIQRKRPKRYREYVGSNDPGDRVNNKRAKDD